MKKNISKYIAIATLALGTLTACEIESHDNGKIDGFWHLEHIDTLATGGTLDVSNEKPVSYTHLTLPTICSV